MTSCTLRHCSLYVLLHVERHWNGLLSTGMCEHH